MAGKDKHLTKKSVITGIVLCLCALAIYLIWGRGSLHFLQYKAESPPKQSSDTEATQSEHDKPPQTARLCLLNNGVCQLLFTKEGQDLQDSKGEQATSATIRSIPQDITTMEAVVFRIEGADFSLLSGVITGLNMDMGETIVRFHKVEDKLYEGRAIMASCTEERMQYRLRLSSEDTGEMAAVDFDAKRAN